MVFGDNFGSWPMVEIRQGKKQGGGLSSAGILWAPMSHVPAVRFAFNQSINQ